MKLLLYFHDYEFTRNCLVSLGFFFRKEIYPIKDTIEKPGEKYSADVFLKTVRFACLFSDKFFVQPALRTVLAILVRIIPETRFFRKTKHYKKSRQEIYITNLQIKVLVLPVVAISWNGRAKRFVT